MSLFKRSNFNKKYQRRMVEKKRKDSEIKNNDEDIISVRLGDVERVFHNGKWVSRGNNSELSDESTTMARCLHDLEERNNLLTLKYDILLDMLLEHLIATQ